MTANFIVYAGTSGWYVIYQILSPFLGRRGWRARLDLDMKAVYPQNIGLESHLQIQIN